MTPKQEERMIKVLKVMQAQKLQDAAIIQNILSEIESKPNKARKSRNWKFQEQVEQAKQLIR